MSENPQSSISDGKKYPFLEIVTNKFTQVGLASGLSLLGPLGAGLQAYLTETINELKERRWRVYWDSVEKRILEIDKNKIDYNYLESEDFLDRFRELYENVTSSSDKEKLKYLRDYLIACVWKVRPDITWRDLFFRYINEYTGTHLVILEQFYMIQGNLSYYDRFELPNKNERVPLTIKQICQITQLNEQLLEILIADMASSGLLREWHGEKNRPNILGWSITNSGIRFMEFLKLAWRPAN